MIKPYTIYMSLATAIDNYCNRHNVTREHIAREIGFTGINATIQLSTALNPNSEKSISHDREQRILYVLEDEDRELYFSMRAKEFGMDVCLERKNIEVLEDVAFNCLADVAMMESHEAFASIKTGLKDGSLDKAELKAVRKECRESAKVYTYLADVADKKLEMIR